MGLHVTPYGTFYVQRSLQTGEVMQVLPVKRPDTPSHLPSVNSLGITENFIERRRASLEADTARVSNSQDRLQQELATAGGERLLATGKAVLAQSDDGGGGGSSSSTHGGNPHSSPSAPNHDGDVEMAFGSSTSGSAVPAPASPASYQHSRTRQNRSNSHQGTSMHYILNEDPHSPPASMAMASNMLPVRPWPKALHQAPTVNLPPFREIDSARALSHEEGLLQEEQISSMRSFGGRRKSTASPPMASLLRSCSRNSSRSNSTRTSSRISGSGGGSGNGSHAFSISNMISHDSEGSVSSAYSISESSTPSVFSPVPDYYYCNSNTGYSPAAIGGSGGCSSSILIDRGSQQVPMPTSRSNKSTPRVPSRVDKAGISPSPRLSPATAPPCPSAPFVPSVLSVPSSPAPLATSQKKTKTVWIIRTLEPRKTTSRRTAAGNEDYDDYEPQRVKTHVETHILP